jgi:hypothetical protein
LFGPFVPTGETCTGNKNKEQTVFFGKPENKEQTDGKKKCRKGE